MQTPLSDLDNAVLLSALEHYGYCPRQCALIHREQTYDENIFTLQGNAVHERVDQPGTATSDGIRSEYSVPLWSVSLGVIGKADLIEFRGDTPYPVEYKHGPSRENNPADLQLCGQAMCLKEMLNVFCAGGRRLPLLLPPAAGGGLLTRTEVVGGAGHHRCPQDPGFGHTADGTRRRTRQELLAH